MEALLRIGKVEAHVDTEVFVALAVDRVVLCIDRYNGTGDFDGLHKIWRVRGYGITLGYKRGRV